ncbi:MAG: hypothetical protein N2259_00195 [Patescibacteria group bacterium]|nr:hypothetical protein [Patescibacteria group bacterium]
MKTKKVFVFLVLNLILFFILANKCLAGFGISPPYVMNENLGRGSHFEQKIVLVRDNPIEDWQAEITIEAREIEKWLSIDKGNKFILPKGETQVPLVVSVDVPKDAEYKRYRGVMRVKTTPLNPPTPGTVAIALGGRIEIDLTVSKEIFGFKVRGVKIEDSEEGRQFWFGYLPGKIKFWLNIENVGNVKFGPTKVRFEIYNEEQTQLLEVIETTKLEKVPPFQTKWILAKLPTKLKAGGYWAEYKIYKNEEIVQEARLHFSLLPYGTISKGKISLADLPIKFRILGGSIILIILIFAGYLIFKKKKINRD